MEVESNKSNIQFSSLLGRNLEVFKEAILSRTNYGIDIYAHILQEYYPDVEMVLSLSGRICSPTANPFNAHKPTLVVFIEKETTLGNSLDKELAFHTDNERAIPDGNVFDFAELHYNQSGDELLQTINKELHLHIGEKIDFYSHNKVATQSRQSPIGQIIQEKEEVSFSFYKSPIKNTIPHKSVSLFQAYKYIVGDYAKERTEKLRSITDPKQARQYKASTFDYCTFSGVFNSRNDKALINHSGLLCVDFDHLPNLEIVFQALLADEYFDTQLLFVSPSGDGLKWIIPIDTSETPHSNYFAAVANYMLQTYGIEVDKSGKDISRACFLAHDPNAYINPQIINLSNSLKFA